MSIFLSTLIVDFSILESMAQAQLEKEEDIQDESPFILIDRLQEQGINAGDISKLKVAGCFTVENLMFRTKKVGNYDGHIL